MLLLLPLAGLRTWRELIPQLPSGTLAPKRIGKSREGERHEGSMRRLVCATALAGVAWTGAASAQEFKGAEVSAEILGYTDDSDLGETTYRGSLEFGVFGGFGVQADLAFHDSRTIDLGARTATIHALYDAFSLATLGLFYSRDEVDSDGLEGSVNIWGIEGGRSFGMAGVEGYVGFLDGEGDDGQLAGVEGTYDITRNISAIGSADILMGDSEATRLAVGGAYRFGEGGPSLFGEIGRVSVDAGGEDSAETFVTLGARLALGRNDGTTFGSRSLFEVLSGF